MTNTPIIGRISFTSSTRGPLDLPGLLAIGRMIDHLKPFKSTLVNIKYVINKEIDYLLEKVTAALVINLSFAN